MPGLVGIIGRSDARKNRENLLAMLDSMQHESFYSSGNYINEDEGIFIGWTCQKDSPCDPMPVVSECKNILLFLYGEHYSDHGVSSGSSALGRLEARYGLKALVDLYQRVGADFVKSLNGWFHGILINLRTREVLLFNDRYGVQRLYYCENGDAFLFSAEAKAILRVRKDLRQLDVQSLGEYLACDCVLENRTLFRGIRILPGASLWTFEPSSQPRKRTYFEPREWEEQVPLSAADLYAQMEEKLPAIISRYLYGVPTIGISLTAGLDSRLIVASIGTQSENVSCYSFDGMYRESYDATLARKVSTICKLKHSRLVLDKDYLTSFPALAERTIYISDGCLNAGSAYELYLNRLARQISPVRLTGSYGSEVFRGQRGFKPTTSALSLIHEDVRKHVLDAFQTYDTISKCCNLTFSNFRQAPWYGYGRISIEQSQVVLRTPYMDNDLIALLYRAPENVCANAQLQWHLIGRGNPALIGVPTDRGLHGGSGILASKWAYFRSFFLFKAEYCYKSGMPNWLERMHYLLGPLQPERLIVGRHRFYHNRIWFRSELAPYLRALLLDSTALKRAYVNGTTLEAIVTRHIKGDENHTDEIDKALTLELIHRCFIDG